jgi:hypothetical protein
MECQEMSLSHLFDSYYRETVHIPGPLLVPQKEEVEGAVENNLQRPKVEWSREPAPSLLFLVLFKEAEIYPMIFQLSVSHKPGSQDLGVEKLRRHPISAWK